MKKRELRHSIIREVISTGRIGNQETLLQVLRGKGLNLTQATLSRDLKEMKVAKIASGAKGYVYLIPEEMALEPVGQKERVNYLAEGFLNIRFSDNLAVIRTLPGYASSIASVIDKMEIASVLGTVAGDDTILVVRKEKATFEELIGILIKTMPILKTKLGDILSR